jgi:hypothetical protein
LKGYKVFGGKVKLKGIQEEMQVYKIVAQDFEAAGDARRTGTERTASPGLRASAGAAAAKRAP